MREYLLISLLAAVVFAWSEAADAQWVLQNSGINSTLTGVVMIDTMTAYAVSHGRSILRTTDRGDTWFDLTAPLSYVMPWNAVDFYDSANGMAVGDYGAVFTIRGGNMAGWCRYINHGPTCLSVLYVDPSNIYVGADSGWIYHSLDSGRTWTSEKISDWPIRSLFKWRGAYALPLPIYALTPHSICSKFELSSAPWSENVLPQLEGLGSQAYGGSFCLGGTSGFIVGVGGDLGASPLVLRKRVSDTSWVMAPSAIPGGGPLYAVSAPSAGVIYACGIGGSIVKSTDGGDSWTQNFPPSIVLSSPALRSISFIDEKRGFAVGEAGTILYTSNGGTTRIDEHDPNTPVDFALEQNYPNPFNPSTAISYKLSAFSNVTLKIFDVLGREVKTLIDNERQLVGRHSLLWDGTNRRGGRVGSGIYYYRLTTDKGTQTKKAVCLR
jgi:photosystem II stability/assembly factor-like uncharacterized protein